MHFLPASVCTHHCELQSLLPWQSQPQPPASSQGLGPVVVSPPVSPVVSSAVVPSSPVVVSSVVVPSSLEEVSPVVDDVSLPLTAVSDVAMSPVSPVSAPADPPGSSAVSVVPQPTEKRNAAQMA